MCSIGALDQHFGQGKPCHALKGNMASGGLEFSLVGERSVSLPSKWLKDNFLIFALVY